MIYFATQKFCTYFILAIVIIVVGTLFTIIGLFEFQFCCHFDRCGINQTMKRYFKAYPSCKTYYRSALRNSFSVSRFPEASFMAYVRIMFLECSHTMVCFHIKINEILICFMPDADILRFSVLLLFSKAE